MPIEMKNLPLGVKSAGSGYYKVSAIIREEDLALVLLALRVSRLLLGRVSRNPTVAIGQCLVALCQEFISSYPQEYSELAEREKVVLLRGEDEVA